MHHHQHHPSQQQQQQQQTQQHLAAHQHQHLQQHQLHQDHHQQSQHQQHQQQHLQDLHLQHVDLNHQHHQQQHQAHHQQQQHHHQQAQQQHPFMANTAQWLGDDSQDDFMPKVVHRRAKRIIPDTEKDEKYWEKRKRNNMAAKRSRENKRVLENDIRQKVTCLEESNAMLRKELALIKSRFGLAPDQNIMTPEERAQCLQEIKANMEANASRRRKESAGSGDDVSSTSTSLYPVSLHVAGGSGSSGNGGNGSNNGASSLSPSSNDGDGERDKLKIGAGDDGDESCSPKLDEESGGAVGGNNALAADVGGIGYGPSAYGPFNPSPSWGPIGPAGINALAGATAGTPNHTAFSSAGQLGGNGGLSGSTKLPPISNAFQEKGGVGAGNSSGGFGRFVGSLGAYARPPYDYFSQYSPQMLYGGGGSENSVLGAGYAPADLSTNRGKRQGDGGSSPPARGANSRSNIGLGSIKSENMGSNSHGLISSPDALASNGGGNGSLLLDDMAAMASSLAGNGSLGSRANNGQESQMLSRGMSVPTRLNTPVSNSSGGASNSAISHGLAAEAAALASQGAQGSIKGPEEEHLKRENDALKMAVRTLTAQMEHMKDHVYKD